MKVLVAEDDIGSSKLVCIIVRRLGLDAVAHFDGQAVIGACNQENFDLILMDMNLPGINGLAVTRAIREMELETGGHVPIIALTGHAFPDDRARCLEAGMDDYLTKPLVMDLLQARVRHWLKLPETPAGQ